MNKVTYKYLQTVYKNRNNIAVIPVKHKELPDYLYHVTLPKHRLSILRHGLIARSLAQGPFSDLNFAGARKLLFAATASKVYYLEKLYLHSQLCGDEYEAAFDYWEIDISQTKHQWYRDPNYNKSYNKNEYLFTTHSIPASMIKLKKPPVFCDHCREYFDWEYKGSEFISLREYENQISNKTIHTCISENDYVKIPF